MPLFTAEKSMKEALVCRAMTRARVVLALWISGVPYWSMNYAGRVTGENFSGDFLKEALLRVPEEEPYRGPREYTGGEYAYHCETEGSFEWFQGKETIDHRGKQIYECYFHGGLIR